MNARQSLVPAEGFRKDRSVQRGPYLDRMKDSERLLLRAVPDKEFLHKKINNRDVYVDYASTEYIPEDALRLYNDLITLN